MTYPAYPPQNNYQPSQWSYRIIPGYIRQTDKSKIVFALLSFFFGSFGVQYFYIGKNTAGAVTLIASMLLGSIILAITLILSIFTFGLSFLALAALLGILELVTLIQTIVVLCMSDEKFERNFVLTDKTFPIF